MNLHSADQMFSCSWYVIKQAVHGMQVVSVDELSDVVEHRLGCSPNFKYFYDPETKSYQGRPHQYNCTYYSALGGNARHYLLARAIQFFTPGIPMVYYVGLFAGLNDYDVGPCLWPPHFALSVP